MAQLKLDECLSASVGALLSEAGHDVTTVVGQGWGGFTDPELWPRIQAEGRILVTADTRFADVRRFPPGEHAGVVLLRPGIESRRRYLALASLLLEAVNLDAVSGTVVVVEPMSVRVRRPAPTKDDAAETH